MTLRRGANGERRNFKAISSPAGGFDLTRSIPHPAFRIPHCHGRIPAMNYETLLFEIKEGVAFVTINRPDKLNALNDQVVDELGHAAGRIASEDAIKGAILTGAGPKAFVAGADIADLATQGPFDGKARALRGQAVLRRLETCGKPVIAAGNGFPPGGRGELPVACHPPLAGDKAHVRPTRL